MNIPECLPSLLPGYVPGQGRVGGIAIVGEAPDNQALVHKRPFMGSSGATLRNIFSALGASELERIAWLTHAVPYRTTGKRPPTAEEIQFYREGLLEELRAANPRVVLLAGGTALHSVSGDKNLKITHERGKLREYEGLTCLPCFSPGNVRHNPGNYRFLKSDIAEAVRLARTGKRREPPAVTYKYVPPHLWDKAVDKIIVSGGIKSADVETTGLDIQTDFILDLGVEITPGFTLVFMDDFSFGSPLNTSLQRLFDPSNGLQWRWHNGKYDCAMLQAVKLPARVDHDTLLAHYCLDENQGGHDLKTLSMELLGADGYDLTRKEKENMASVPPKKRHSYMAKDVCYTTGIADIILPKVERDPDLKKLYYETLIPVSNLLTHIEANGIGLSLERLAALDKKLTEERDALTKACRELIGDPEFNPKSPTQVKKILYLGEPWRLKPLKKIGMTTRELALERYESKFRRAGRTDSPVYQFLVMLRKLRKINKRKDTYVDGFRRRIAGDGRVHPTFKQHGTTTGRLSASDPPTHAIPREPEVRAIVEAAKDNILLEIDWSQVELRLLADKSRDPGLVKVYVNEEDLHDEVVHSVIKPTLPHITEYVEQRYQAKIVNFGTAYGRTADSMSTDYDLPLQDCEAIIGGWKRRFPVANAFLESQAARAMSGQPMITRFGRKRRFGLITRETRNHIQNQAKNNDIQSEASDLTARCAVELRRILPDDVKIINMVHDAILFELPNNPQRIRETASLCIRTMEQWAKDFFQSPVPFVADGKIGRSWGYCRGLPRPDDLDTMPEAALLALSSKSKCPKDTDKKDTCTGEGYCTVCGEPL